jgi:DtxR family Mn-dependent transcriptional regulator
VDERRLVSLAELGLGRPARVIRVSDEDAGMLRYLAEMGIVPGVLLTVEGREPFGGPITLRLGDATRSVGPELAGHVRVEEVEDPAAGDTDRRGPARKPKSVRAEPTG